MVLFLVRCWRETEDTSGPNEKRKRRLNAQNVSIDRYIQMHSRTQNGKEMPGNPAGSPATYAICAPRTQDALRSLLYGWVKWELSLGLLSKWMLPLMHYAKCHFSTIHFTQHMPPGQQLKPIIHLNGTYLISCLWVVSYISIAAYWKTTIDN